MFFFIIKRNLISIGAEVRVSELKHLDEHDHGHDVPAYKINNTIKTNPKYKYMKVVSNWKFSLVGQMW